jgi:SAM-dependent methyltransferase
MVTGPDALVSRFLRTTDAHASCFFLPLPKTWWSRGYEYLWAGQFALPGAVVLDAGSGIPHPFKFWLAEHSVTVYAVDVDPRITVPEAVYEAVAEEFGEKGVERVRSAIGAVHTVCASLERLPFAAETFDTVFCLSTWEHLTPIQQAGALVEMGRVVKPSGYVVLTMDVPPASPDRLQLLARRAGLAFAGPVDFHRDRDSVFNTPWGPLSCFRTLLVPQRRLPAPTEAAQHARRVDYRNPSGGD